MLVHCGRTAPARWADLSVYEAYLVDHSCLSRWKTSERQGLNIRPRIVCHRTRIAGSCHSIICVLGSAMWLHQPTRTTTVYASSVIEDTPCETIAPCVCPVKKTYSIEYYLRCLSVYRPSAGVSTDEAIPSRASPRIASAEAISPRKLCRALGQPQRGLPTATKHFNSSVAHDGISLVFGSG